MKEHKTLLKNILPPDFPAGEAVSEKEIAPFEGEFTLSAGSCCDDGDGCANTKA